MVTPSSAAINTEKNPKNYRMSEATEKLRQQCDSNTGQESTKLNN